MLYQEEIHHTQASETPRVSIIVPVYNVRDFLHQCVNSIIGQTLENIEIVLVDDGSTDGSGEIADEFAALDSRIVVIHKKNGGLSDARNVGIEAAKGDFIGFVDSDDWIEPEMFELLYQRAVTTDSELVLCASTRHNVKKSRASRIALRGNLNMFGKSVSENPWLIYSGQSYAWNKLYARRLFDDPSLRFPVGQWFEDSAVVYNIMASANRIQYVDEALYNYRFERPGSITSTVSRKIFDVFKSCDSIISHFTKNDLIKGSTQRVLEIIIRNHIIARFDVILLHADTLMATRYINKSFHYLDTKFPGWRSRYETPPEKARSWLFASRKNRALAYAWAWTPSIVRKKGIRLFDKTEKFIGKLKKPKPEIPASKLRALQLEQIGILNILGAFCRKHDIRYYLAEGTLLGAVRHAGMIPWDDDIDIAVPREDYERLISIPADQWPQEIRLWARTTDRRYPLPFSKAISTAPSDFKTAWPKDTPERFAGPFVDIFPLDFTAKPIGKERTPVQKKIRLWRDMLLIKRGYKMKKTWKNRLLKFVVPFISFRSLQSRIYRDSIRENESLYSSHVVNLASSYLPHKQTFPREWFGKPSMFMFEGTPHPCPSEPHLVLKQTYGNFMTLPPVEKRGRSTHFMRYAPRVH